jgi:flagellin-like protein
MDFMRKRAVSPVIATLLLIAIAVAAGIIVYVYVNSLSTGLTSGGGQQVSQQLQLEAYSFNTAGTGSGQVIDIFLKNVGGGSLTISSIYFDGTALVEWTPTAGSYIQYLMVPNSGQSCFAAVPSTAAFTFTTSVSSGTGTAATCTGGPTVCTVTNFCFNTASGQVETLTLATQTNAQVLVGLNAVQTAGTSHTIKIITSTGGQAVFTVTTGRTG